MNRSAAALVLVGSLPMALAAQGRYTRTRGDTLRYREVTTADITLDAAQGPIKVTSEQESQLAVTFAGRDSARAWYESLLLSASSPQGTTTPGTESLKRQPFHLRLTARGAVTLLAAPAMPAEVAAITDLTHQFDDFFLRLPAGTLTRGRSWRDTVTLGDSTGAKWYLVRREARYTVLRDTVVAGTRALVIIMQQALTLASGGPVANQPVRTAQRLVGSDSGTVIFSPATGRMLARARSGMLTGTMEITQLSGVITLPQRYTFESRIERLP